ncbi:MAG: hypothetical protein L3K03_09655, partial [Thermoplasmata archaeon]|nr:hypothetical protein [Thermoplasmata archaeon]
IDSFTASPSTIRVDTPTTFSVAATGGVNPLTYTYVGLPPGCFSRDTPSLACTPTSSGAFYPRLFLNDSVRNSANAFVELLVTLPPETNYSVMFTEANLAYGTNWTVTILSQSLSSVTAGIVFTLTNGTYDFTLTTVPGYSVSPASGSVTVNGTDLSRTIVFTLTGSKSSSATGLFGLPGVQGDYLLVGIVFAIGVLVAIFLGTRGSAPAPAHGRPSPPKAADTDPDAIDLSPDQVRE